MSGDDDDKPTVILDLNAIRKQKQKQEEDLANIAQDLEFAVATDEEVVKTSVTTTAPKIEALKVPEAAPVIGPDFAVSSISSEEFAEQFLEQRAHTPEPEIKTKVILFDFNSDFFEKSKSKLPLGYEYQIARTLPELNKILSSKTFQIVVFNYDVNPKAVNQLTAQIKKKFPVTKTMIVAKAISPEKAKAHAATSSGANGYYKLPLEASTFEAELKKIHTLIKKAG